jgi:hypothetical protein
LPPVLLAAVAVVQIGLARGAGLSPWLGGGFGMFSTTDAWGRRHLHAFAWRTGLRRELRAPPSLDPAVRRALALPTERHLRELAAALARLPAPDEAPLEAIEIQVFARRYDPATLAPSDVPIRSLRTPVAEP